ncbi:DegT/DnrJ/EryC1/StrS family aminotransferase [Flavobacterium eburneipallidum]|uniref:DegT/DnrJ/EryC1/StrS family aminotransferase n=1 Tax=Flavobacterium eburneipallidum TaxID=3003263 RepID=UPI00248278CB|nr:DegT/DnrJ/EryC1/StrS family aminotransferase [Flavobacterium eburneipallidum]
MSNKKIWLSSFHLAGNEQKYVQEALDSNRIASEGDNLDGFEQDLESYLSNDFSVGALSSGTAALHLGLILLGVQAGDEVLCQSMTFVASANPILYLKATPVFIDSESETWNLCPIALEEAILDRMAKGQKPKAIIAVHLFGVPYKIDEIRTIANKYEIPILEDAAEALGSSYKGQKCGAFGDIAVLSFNGNKIITTSGGGAIITKTKTLRDKAMFLATQSRDDAPHYQHSEIGFNYRMNNVVAGIGRAQMEVLEDRIVARRNVHDFYVELFKNIEGVSVFTTKNEDSFSNYWLTTLIIDPVLTNGIDREKLRLAFEAENIESRPLWKPMHLQPIFGNCPYYGNKVAETLFEKGLCLPSGSNLEYDDKERIKNLIFRLFLKNE